MQSLTVSYISSKWIFRSVALGVIAVPSGSRTGANIAAEARRNLTPFGLLGKGRVLVGTTADGNPAEQLGGHVIADERKETSLVCAAHTVALVVKAGLSAPPLALLVSKVHRLARALRKSKKLRFAVAAVCARVRGGPLNSTLEVLLGGAVDDEDVQALNDSDVSSEEGNDSIGEDGRGAVAEQEEGM